MKKLALILGLLTISTPAFSATWIEYLNIGKTIYYYDKDSVKIKTLGNGTKYLEVWEKRDHPMPQLQTLYPSNCNQYFTENCNKYYQQSKVKSVYDCWNNKIQTLYRVDYDSNYSTVFSKDISSTTSLHSSNNWEDVVPETVGEIALKQICSAYRHQLK